MLMAGGAVAVVGTAFATLFAGQPTISSENDQEDANRNPEPVGHVPTDLMQGHHPRPDERAIDAFRPDMSAQVPPEEREAYRPVTVPVK
jgi:hypothetical protein